MEGYRLRSAHGDTIDPRQPLPVDTVEAQETSSVAPTITYNGKAAAGAISINSLALKPIISATGDQVGSYWGLEQNKVYTAYANGHNKKDTAGFLSVTETASSAAITIFDPDRNLELMFESVTGTVKRFIVKVWDKSGGSLYGWVRGVSVSSNVYTFEIMNARVAETQSWVGTLGDFDNTALERVEIFHYDSSLSFGTGTTLTEEVECPKEYSKNWEQVLKFAAGLSNGQYFVDYMRGRIVGKRADTTASEVVTYNVWASTTGGSSGPSTNVAVTAVVPGVGATNLGKAEDAAHSSGDVGVMALGVRKDTAAQTAGTDGDYCPLIFNSTGHQHVAEGFAPQAEDNTNGVFATQNKPVAVSTYAWSVDKSAALEASSVTKASAGVIRLVSGRVDSTLASGTYYFQVLNAASLPADGAVTTLVAPTKLVHTNGIDTPIYLDFTMNGVYASTGIVWCLSTSEFTKSISGAYVSASCLYI